MERLVRMTNLTLRRKLIKDLTNKTFSLAINDEIAKVYIPDITSKSFDSKINLDRY